MRPEHFSVSQLTTYLQCPRKYRFRYVDHIAAERRSPNLLLGQAVHSAVEWWFRERMEGREPQIEAVLRIFRADWTAAITDPTPIDWEEYTEDGIRQTGESLVRLFVERFAAEAVPDQVEHRFEVALVDPSTGGPLDVPLVGYLDFSRGDVLYEIKTCARRTAPSNWALQLAAYSYAVRETLGRSPKVQLVELIKTKDPKIEVVTAPILPEDEVFFLDVATSSLRSIESDAFHPSPGWYCPSCEFRRTCRG